MLVEREEMRAIFPAFLISAAGCLQTVLVSTTSYRRGEVVTVAILLYTTVREATHILLQLRAQSRERMKTVIMDVLFLLNFSLLPVSQFKMARKCLAHLRMRCVGGLCTATHTRSQDKIY
ncbi:hypothetical protein E2C01_016922 [Portunus trituberculatus]|uniref:Uncharacterized protein n=1 Tax=Portunus trituberculatus TaxID=210409 RepID=A0A5B7DRI3_PORTR|nr:hypothetical protein [Portunus trituberculatus]